MNKKLIVVNNRNLSFLFGILFIISLFLTWINKGDFSLLDLSKFAQTDFINTLSQYMFIYIGFVFLLLGVISLLMNFIYKIRLSRIAIYLVPLYFIIVWLLNILEPRGGIIEKSGSSLNIIDLLKELGIGFYFFLISFVGLLIFLKVEKKKKKYNLQDSVAKTSGFKEDERNDL